MPRQIVGIVKPDVHLGTNTIDQNPENSGGCAKPSERAGWSGQAGNATRVDALYYGQGLGGVIFDCLNNRDAEGNSLLAAVTGGVCPISLVRVVLKWGADVNSVNQR